MANRIVSVHAGIYGMGIYAIMLPSSGFSVAHYHNSQWCSNECNDLDSYLSFLKPVLEAFKLIHILKVIKLMKV